MADREYQTRTVQRIRDAIRQKNKRILVVLPTGAGKGYIASRLMEMCAMKGNDSSFLAASRELIFQLGSQLDRLGIPYHTTMAGVENEYESSDEHSAATQCNLIAKDTLIARAFKTDKIEVPASDMVQIDEAHQSISETYGRIIEYHLGKIIIGWTATPVRTDGRSLAKYYDVLIQGATYKELQDLGFLVPVRIISPNLKPDLDGLKVGKASGDYGQRELAKRMDKEEMVGDIVKEWKRNNGGGLQTIGFFCSVKHSIHARDEFRKHLGKDQVEHIDGRMHQSERDDIMGRIRDGSVLVTCNYGIAHTGVDVPGWKYLICARPTKSFMLWRQMGGRIQRPFGDQKWGWIQDHTDNSTVFGYPDEDVAWCLDTDVRAENLPRTKKRKADKKEANEHTCKRCGTNFVGYICPSCGHQEEQSLYGEAVKMVDGVLYELKREKKPVDEKAQRNKKHTRQQKQKAWDNFMGVAIGRGMKVGAAAGMYRNEYGVWPRGLECMPKGKSEWGMKARDFYNDIVKPDRKALDAEIEAAVTEINEGLFG